MSDGLRFFSFVAPYCALRLIALVAGYDQGSTVHLREHLATVHNAREIALGMWSGLRALWAFVAIAPILLFSKGRVAGAAILLVAIAGTLVASVPLAHDLSRTASTLLPPAVLGIILMVQVPTFACGVADRGGPGVQSADARAAHRRRLGKPRPDQPTARRDQALQAPPASAGKPAPRPRGLEGRARPAFRGARGRGRRSTDRPHLGFRAHQPSDDSD